MYAARLVTLSTLLFVRMQVDFVRCEASSCPHNYAIEHCDYHSVLQF
jgi:hypothetical protein